MESSHFGELGLGNGGSGSSRKGKKSSTDKPKQPQRGLGVAQLEKIRLHNQMASYLPSLHQPPYQASLNKVQFLIDFGINYFSRSLLVIYGCLILRESKNLMEDFFLFFSLVAGGCENRTGFFVVISLFFLVPRYLVFTLSSPSQYYGKSMLKLVDDQ